jgi:NADPH:quinone reductase-like Zn-dependent oxidoreductase
MRNATFVPGLMRLPVWLFMLGALRPKIKILGIDLAGEVEAVGKGVGRFKEGDQVFGTPSPALGVHAEYICLPEDGMLVPKPTNMTWEEAACLPLAGNTALYFLKDLGRVQAGQQVLINGASGAIGTFAVQLAKAFGAQVTGMCSTTNVEMVRSLGADRVIDYTQEDFTTSGESYDVIFDVVSKLSYARCKGLLKERGLFLVTVPTLASMVNSQHVKLGDAVPSVENLLFLKELAEAGKLRSVIDRCYPLEQTAEAFQYVEKGHKKGNVVIVVEHDNPQK